VIDLLLYTRKIDGKGCKWSPFCALIEVRNLKFKVLRQTIYAHKDSSLILKDQGH